MWRPYGKESHSTRGSRECFGCVFDLRACTRQAVSLTPLYVMVLVSVCARRRAGPPVHVYDRARARAYARAQRPERGPTGPRGASTGASRTANSRSAPPLRPSEAIRRRRVKTRVGKYSNQRDRHFFVAGNAEPSRVGPMPLWVEERLCLY